MTQQQNDNVKLLTNSLISYGISNPNLQAGILATIFKESNFIPQSENLNYSASSLASKFPRYFPNLAAAKPFEKNQQLIANKIYGNRMGNTDPNDGYLYRGRGFNQITGKANYKKVGDAIGVDLVSNPDLLNDPKIAADAAAYFFSTELKAGLNAGSFTKFGVTSLDTINDTTRATQVAVQINAGRGTDFNNSIVQQGYGRATGVVDTLLKTIKAYTPDVVVEKAKETTEVVKKNPYTTILVVSLMVTAFVIIVRTIKQNKK